MLKAFIFVVMIWNSSTFASKKNISHLRFLLGCRAEIPCQLTKSDSNSFKWFYKKDENTEKIQIYFEDKTGLQHHNTARRRGSVTHSRALVINNFTDDDQGLYWCEIHYKDNHKSETSAVIRVTKETLSEIHDTRYVTAGSSFTYLCPGEFTNFKWTFNSNYTIALNKSLHIVNVKRANAGKYTCWADTCVGHRQKICIVNVCVIAVHGNSSASCTVICDMQFSHIKPNSISNEVTRAISVHVTPHGSLNCSEKQMFDAHSTINSTHAPSNAGTNTQPEYLLPVVYGTFAALTCFVLLALLIFYFRPRLRSDVSHNPDCNTDAVVEEEPSVVYTSVVFKTPPKTTKNNMNYSDCVYSELNV